MVHVEQKSCKARYGSVANSEEFVPERSLEDEFVAYPQRWAVLLAFSFLSCLNNWIWITWSPMTAALADFWSVPMASVDDLSAVFMYVYIPLSFPALNFLHKYKLRAGLLVGGGLNFAGALVRYWGMRSYSWVYVGTFLCASCQTLTLAMPPLISTLWFRETERGLATSVGVLANQLGGAFGLGAGIFLHFTSGDEDTLNDDILRFYLVLQMIFSGMSFVLIFSCVQSNSPPTPPSEAASYQKQTTYIESIRLLLEKRSGTVLCVVYGLAVGVLYAIATFLSQFFLAANKRCHSDETWSEKEAGYLGVVLIMIGLLGSLLSGEYLDKTQGYRKSSIVLLLGSLVSMLGFLLYLQFFPWNRYMAYTTISFLGFFLTGFISVGFEYGAAISYPADEAAVAGVLNVAAQVGGWALVEIGGELSPVGRRLNDVLVGTLLLALTLLLLLVRATSKRPS